jgi:hypothetical protein
VLNSQFLEGSEDPSKPGHRTIEVTEDFDVLYAIVYYLYTSHIIFDNGLIPPLPLGPKVIDSTIIYTQADRLLLPDLKRIAFEFFKSTLGVKNVTTYTFDEDLCLHKEIESCCSEFFSTHLEEVVESNEYIEFFAELEKCSIERQAWVDSRFRKLVQNELRTLKRKRQEA